MVTSSPVICTDTPIVLVCCETPVRTDGVAVSSSYCLHAMLRYLSSRKKVGLLFRSSSPVSLSWKSKAKKANHRLRRSSHERYITPHYSIIIVVVVRHHPVQQQQQQQQQQTAVSSLEISCSSIENSVVVTIKDLNANIS